MNFLIYGAQDRSVPSRKGAMPEAPGGGHSTQLLEPDETAPAEVPVEVPPRPLAPDRPEDPPPKPDERPLTPAEPPVEFAAEFDEFAPFVVPAAGVAPLFVTLDVVATPVGVALADGAAPELVVGSTTALPRAGTPPGWEALPAGDCAVCAAAGSTPANAKSPIRARAYAGSHTDRFDFTSVPALLGWRTGSVRNAARCPL